LIEEAPIVQESENVAALSEEVKKEEDPPQVIVEPLPPTVIASQTPKALNEEEFARSIMESLRLWQDQQQ
jgi:hypothetical protein